MRSMINRLKKTSMFSTSHARLSRSKTQKSSRKGPGWIAFIDDFDGTQLWGWVKRRDSDDPQSIDIIINGVRVIHNYVANEFRKDVYDSGNGNGFCGFRISINALPPNKTNTTNIEIRDSHSGKLIATKRILNVAAFYSFASNMEFSVENISGWFVDKSEKARVFTANLYIDNFFYATIKNDLARPDLAKKNVSGGRGGFSIKSPLPYMEGSSFTLSIRYEGGASSQNHIYTTEKRHNTPQFKENEFTRRGITIIVPIYNAAEDVEVCIERLLAYTASFAKILLIDDASSDASIGKILSRYEHNDRIRVLKNPHNIGFTKTINRGISETSDDHVILLNSDARVTPGWIEGMLMAYSSHPKIATVTAMSDRAGAFSAPEIGNSNNLPAGVDEISFARAFRRRGLGLYPPVPTGNGFCMFISRDCITAIGSLDSDAFPKGYGEENDFCMRALRAGWRNVIDDKTYVFHERSKSFGSAKENLMSAGRAVLDERYPEYTGAIKIFSTCEKISLCRYQARRALDDCISGHHAKRRLLTVISTTSGGTPQTNQDLMNAINDTFDCWLLVCDSKTVALHRMINGSAETVRAHTFSEPVSPVSHRSSEYDTIVGGWLYNYSFDIVHIRHIARHSLGLIEIAKIFGSKVVFSFHDFYVVSPTIKLIDDTGTYLGTSFRAEGSAYRESLWPRDSLPIPQGQWLAFWQQRFEATFTKCDAYITTSQSAYQVITDNIKSLAKKPFHVIPHGRDFTEFGNIRHVPSHGEPIRIIVPGNINAAKGLEIILKLIEIDKARCLEFHILGDIDKSLSVNKKALIRHGRYERKNFLEKAASIRPHLGVIFSIWDETYCHTLTELWSAGVAPVVFDFPTLAGRVRENGMGWVVDHTDVERLYDNILRIAFDTQENNRVSNAISEWQVGAGLVNSTRAMACKYLNIYRDLLIEDAPSRKSSARNFLKADPPRIAVLCPCDKDLQHAPGSTYIRIWERTRNKIERELNFIRVRPAELLAGLKCGHFEAAIIQRTAVPITIVDELITAFSDRKTPYLMDVDDDLLNVPSDKDPDGAYASYAPSLRKLFKNATLVSVSTIHLANSLRTITRNVVLLPNALSNRLWRSPPPARAHDGTVRGLYMGTMTHDADLGLIMPALDVIAAEFPSFRFSLIGVTAGTKTDESRARWLEIIPMPEEARNYEMFIPWLRLQASRFDFGVAPLRRTSFNQSKSDLKIKDYSGLGLPTIASDVDIYRIDAPDLRLVKDGIEEWTAALTKQIQRSSAIDYRTSAQHDWVSGHHMLEATLDDFDKMILDMISAAKSEHVSVA